MRMHLDGRPPRKYIPVDGVELKAIVTTAVSDAMVWEDAPLPEDDAIHAAFPTRSGKHDIYGEAMRLVSGRRSKGALVALVNWLLIRLEGS